MKHAFSSFYQLVKERFDPAQEGSPFDSRFKELKETQAYRYSSLKISKRLIVR